MKKTEKLFVSAMAAAMMLGLAGCGNASDTDKTEAETTAKTEETAQTTTSDTEVVSTDGPIEVSGEFDVVPDEYPWIAAADFQAAFDEFYAKSNEANATSMTYDDIEAIFGTPGAYYVDKDYNDGQYKYYKWFSDDGKDVLITFSGDGMTYFAWTSGTVTPSN